MQQQLQFPKLPVTTIIHCLAQLGIGDIRPQQITQPTKEFATTVYIRLTEIFGQCSFEDIIRTPLYFSARNAMMNPEMHEESVPQTEMLRKVQRFMRDIGVENWTFLDLLQPVGKRFIEHLSAFIGFAEFKLKLVDRHKQMVEGTEQFVDQLEETLLKHEDLEAELAGYKEQEQKDETKATEEEQDIRRIETQLHEMNQQQKHLEMVNASLKEECDELQQRLKSETIVLDGLKTECRDLEQQVVHDPEQLQQKVKELTKSVETTKQQLVDNKLRFEELNTRKDSIAKADKDVKKALRLMGECEEALAELRRVQKEQKHTQASIESFKEKAASLISKQVNIRRQIDFVRSKQQSARDKAAQQKDHTRQLFEDYDRQKKTIQTHRQGLAKSIDANQIQILEMQKKIEQMTRAHMEDMQRMLQQQRDMENQVRIYNQRLMESIGDVQ